MTFHQKAEDSKFLIYVPLSGAATISSSNRHHISEPGKGTIIDMTSLSDIVINGDREHLSLIIDQSGLSGYCPRCWSNPSLARSTLRSNSTCVLRPDWPFPVNKNPGDRIERRRLPAAITGGPFLPVHGVDPPVA
ncbi:hypothetical protein ACOJBO_12605 [Rhizobium beringeri]